MIHVADLTKTFLDPKRGEVHAVDHVSFDVRAGEVFGLLGPNGAGKTTTLRILCTVLKPTGGAATVAGFDVVKQANQVRHHIGFLSANTGVYERMTAWEMVAYYGRLHGLHGPALRRRIDELFDRLQMNDFRDVMGGKLSTGMKQKVSIARALVHDPPVLIFDEPTAGLDVLVQRAVLRQIASLRAAGKCILFSTHIMREVEKLCDRVAIMHRGRILVCGTLDELRAKYGQDDLEELFFALVGEDENGERINSSPLSPGGERGDEKQPQARLPRPIQRPIILTCRNFLPRLLVPQPRAPHVRTDRYLFTSESVSMGHPDKVADQISDAVLDYCLAADPLSRVACETLVTTDLVVVAGEITSKADLSPAAVEKIAREAVREIGYVDPNIGFAADTCKVHCHLHSQSPHIAMGVDVGGAGDQGMMFGFACDETQTLMPLPIHLAHRLVENHAAKRRSGELKFVRPDAKSQVTVEYDADGTPYRIHTVVLSTQHDESVLEKRGGKDYFADAARQQIIDKLILPTLKAERSDLIRGNVVMLTPDQPNKKAGPEDILCYINPTGCFLEGGPHGDCGLTGRKIIVDTYGGRGRHGGGAFSGKDPTKVDRSAAYMARYIAKNVVAAGLARQCEVQLSYAIGHPDPLNIWVNTAGSAQAGLSDPDIAELIRGQFRLTPKGIIETLDLRRPIYRETARNGHFGRALPNFTWEKTDKADALRAAATRLAAAVA